MATIAIVEDDATVAEMYKFKLEKGGYKCIVAHDGKEGLELIEKTKPDLVLLDLMLPQITGDQVLVRMRQADWGKDVKVIVMTNVSEYEAPENLKSLGVLRYLVKAMYTPNQIIKFVNQALGTDGPAQPVVPDKKLK